MHSKRYYKICICSVILGELDSFWSYKAFKIIFLKILDAIYCIMKVGIFLIPLSITLFNQKIFFLGGEMWKIELQKIEGNLFDELRK